MVAGRATWQAELDALLVRDKAHTREGDAIAAARRRLPMVKVDSTISLTGPHGPVTLLEVFEGRRQPIAYFHMWHAGRPAAAQCEGCTFYNGQVRELSYLHSRDVTWMSVIAVLVLAQKLLPPKAAIDVPLALAIVGLGILVVIAPSSVPGLTPPM